MSDIFVTPRTIARQAAPPSLGFPRQEYWSGLPLPSPGDLPDPGTKPRSPALEADTLTSESPGKPRKYGLGIRNEGGQRLIEFCQENALVIANTLFQQHKRRIYGQQSQIDYILCSQRWRNSIQSGKTRLGADHGSDHELLIAKFRLKLKKVGEITIPFRYDLNQISYNYTVQVRNRFKGLDLIVRMPKEL